MSKESRGIKPELGVVATSLYWLCGFCNEPMYKIKDTAISDTKYCPNYCPFCGAKVDKGETYERKQ